MALSSIRVVAIIPARLASSRLPGKPLLEIRGLPMVEHVRRRAVLCGRFDDVVVATCDAAIAQTVERYGGRWVMTSPHHPAATDRVAEAVQQLDCSHVVNVQGDEILVLPEDLSRLVEAIEAEPGVPAWNAIAPIERADELQDRSIVKCVVSRSNRILCCGRDFSAWGRVLASPTYEPIRQILGILGYRRDFLQRYGQLLRTPLEHAESIDQSRIIEHDVLLRGVAFRHGYPGINESREVAVVERILQTDPLQQQALETVLGFVPAHE